MFGYRRIAAGSCVAILGMLAWQSLAVGAAPSHLAGIACDSCHLAGKQIVAAQAHKLIASQEVLCGRCHANAVRVSHPSGLAPKAKPPPEYPLDWKGDLTCSTCHLPHAAGVGLLRGAKRGRDLCTVCHEAAFFRGMKDQGTSVEQSGHLTAGIELRNADLDAYSLQCLQCHETRADPRGVRVDLHGRMRPASGSATHPIGRSYQAAARFGGFRPVVVVSRKIFMPEGKVSCVSCHQGYSKEHGKLVVARSLCMECHDL